MLFVRQTDTQAGKHSQTDTDRQTETKTDRQAETERQTDRQRERDRDRDKDKDRQTETQRKADRDGQTDRDRQTETDRQTDKQTETQRYIYHWETSRTRGQISGRPQPVVAEEKDQQERDDGCGVQGAQQSFQHRHVAGLSSDGLETTFRVTVIGPWLEWYIWLQF